MEKLIYSTYRRVGFTSSEQVYVSVHYLGEIVVVHLILLLVHLFRAMKKVKWAKFMVEF